MPLEALRWDVTPVGLHYLLTHYDIPADLEQVASRGGRTRRATAVPRPRRSSVAPEVEVVDDGMRGKRARADRAARRELEAPGSSRPSALPGGTGSRLRPSLPRRWPRREPSMSSSQGSIVASRAERSRATRAACRSRRPGRGRPRVRDERAVLAPQHGFLRLVVPGWYGMTSVKWLARLAILDTPFDGISSDSRTGCGLEEDEPGELITRIRVRALMILQGFPTSARDRRPGRSAPSRGAHGRANPTSQPLTCRSTAGARGPMPS